VGPKAGLKRCGKKVSKLHGSSNAKLHYTSYTIPAPNAPYTLRNFCMIN